MAIVIGQSFDLTPFGSLFVKLASLLLVGPILTVPDTFRRLWKLKS